MTWLFVLLDKSSGSTTTLGEALTPAKLLQAAELLTVYANRDVGAYWGLPGGCIVRAGSSPTDIQVNEVPINIRPTIDEAPSAIAYHTVNGVGIPDIEDGLSLSETIFNPDGALTAWSHEIAETIGDPGANELSMNALQSSGFMRELCDPVEAFSYTITTPSGASGNVSDFVLPPYFIPNSAGPYDFMVAKGLIAATAGPQAPFTCAGAGGGDYQVVFSSIGGQTQVTAMGRPEKRRLARKRHPTSRAYRLGLRL
jgi:hypothetical protein